MKSFTLLLLLFWEINRCPIQSGSTYQAYSYLKQTTYPLLKNNKFKLKSGRLDILTKNGVKVSFVDQDSRTDETATKTYEYLGEIQSIGSFFVNEMGYEVGSVIMVTKSGKKVKVWDAPYVSQDGKLAVALSQSIDSELAPNGIQVLSLVNGEVVSKCDLYLKHLEPQDIRWINNTSFVIKFQAFTEEGNRVNKFSYKKFIF